MKSPYFSFLFLLAFAACNSSADSAQTANADDASNANPGKALVREMVAAMGGLDKWHSLQDIEYTYTYRNPATGRQDVSTERYVYDGELSWARYTEHTQSLMPDQPGEVIQGFDGETAWLTYKDSLMTEPQYVNRAMFSRKTNFYWLNMMYKLLDPGVHYEQMEDQTLRGNNYHRVKITFGDNVGDAQDIYLLYINPDTKLVDYFLFTVMAYGRSEPLLTEVTYETIDGLKFPAMRRYAPADWEGTVAADANWMEAIVRDIKTNSGFETAMFDPPAS
ncbi:DUF6503 family protein [Flavilitoribacter nigricans]|uniref:Outer membrane lipoprotein-sorting protein n=1 Tax=Flavilitoribacter nigricans (strain ATCC 23147 / DSM 23189 / NBRC 102662 / NCIMB 1420 / SS-2) TaxID=1122177 RepID=A0A2D0NHR0_FLAN2|nr:DUF6503 family protein [Flavilitoribacter nigricans]PHN07916.1 hypothetical protein CRP01_03950 [Flavilitoribacter nigricans DSM 23189 = NBRC 102662]